MIDTSRIISSFGDPVKEFTLYPDCEYLFCELKPCVYKGRNTENGNAVIQLNEDQTEREVPISDLFPIPLTVAYFDHDQNESSVPIGTEIKEWKYKNSVVPYRILYNGQYFVYTDDKLKEETPLPVEYLSDIQAIRFSYLKYELFH